MSDISVGLKILSSETRSSQADHLITTVSVSERSLVTLTTRMDTQTHMSVSLPSSSRILTTVAQPSSLPSVTQGDHAMPATSRSIATQSAMQSSCDEPESKLSDCPATSIDPHKAAEAFKQHRSDLLIAVTDPLLLANSLYAQDIANISGNTQPCPSTGSHN